ncbi:MAG: hypothetical protein ACTS3R_12925, partial [Inquilinaceae bacterium]
MSVVGGFCACRRRQTRVNFVCFLVKIAELISGIEVLLFVRPTPRVDPCNDIVGRPIVLPVAQAVMYGLLWLAISLFVAGSLWAEQYLSGA